MESRQARIRSLLALFFPPPDTIGLDNRLSYVERWCNEEGVTLLFPEEFPPLLQQIADPPPWLFVKGEKGALFKGVPLALVGTRRPSPYGMRAAHHFAHDLVKAGVTLVSGLARGIDAVAHGAAVLAKRPTAAVLGHGLDRLYPAENRGLAGDILAVGGCLVSEYPPGVRAQPFHFPRRNRILSGLSYGVLVVEAGGKSGSLITARHALEQNREVFVVPGPFFEQGFEGSHWLLQQGAKLVLRAEQVLEDLAPGLLQLEPPLPPEGAIGKRLRRHLRTRGVVTLEEILQVNEGDSRETLAAIEAARERGWLVESSPQCFVYVGK